MQIGYFFGEATLYQQYNSHFPAYTLTTVLFHFFSLIFFFTQPKTKMRKMK